MASIFIATCYNIALVNIPFRSPVPGFLSSPIPGILNLWKKLCFLTESLHIHSI